MRPVTNSHRLHRACMQKRQVERGSNNALRPQYLESLGDRPAHEPEFSAVVGQAPWVGLAAVQGSGNTGDEDSVVGQPARQVGNAPHREPASAEPSLKLAQARVGVLVERRWLLSDAHVFRKTGSDDATNPRESQGNWAGNIGWEPGTATRDVAEKQHERASRKLGELSGRRLESLPAQGDEHEIEGVLVGLVDNRHRRDHDRVGQHVACAQTLMGYFIGPRAVRQHRYIVPGGPELGAIDGPDQTGPNDQNLHLPLLASSGSRVARNTIVGGAQYPRYAGEWGGRLRRVTGPGSLARS